MATTNFPASLDNGTNLPNPGTNDLVANVDHAAQHDVANDALKAIETKLGTGASTPIANRLLRGTGTGVTSYAQVVLTTDVTGTLPVANGGTGVTSSTGTGSVVLSSAPALTGGGSWAGSPALTTPAIADFTNANHNHANAAGGGTLGFAALSSTIFSSQVQTYTNTGTGGGTISWINLGGLKIAWSNNIVSNATAWNTVSLGTVGYTAAPAVTANSTETTGVPPGWVELAQFSPAATGAPQATGFSFLTRQSGSSNSTATVVFFAIGI
jgi:hypothetical protein